MKEILSVKATSCPKIEDITQRRILESDVVFMSMYIGYMDRYLISHQLYINVLFRSIDSLYKCYELSQEHFKLLVFAAGYLEKLCNGEAECLSTPVELDRAKTELGDYLDKVTIIFQTAADITKNAGYADKAREYSAKADKVRGVISFKSYEEKMQLLYEKAASKCEEYEGFIKDLFLARADEYREKCRLKETAEESSARFFAHVPREDQEVREPLLSSGLRRRAIAVPGIWRG